jgi:hypothetical protein
MKNISAFIVLTAALGMLLFLSCKREYSYEGGKNNKPPLAAAGSDIAITLPLDSVLLDGSKYSDPDGKISVWQWTKVSGPASVTIANANAATTQVANLTEGIYQFELKVTDAGGPFSKDRIQVTVDSSNGENLACDNSDRPTINAQLLT